MSAQYIYTLGTQFTATQIDCTAFENQIKSSSISSATVQSVIESGTSVVITFSGTLSGTDQTTLSNLVAAYVYVAPTDFMVDTSTAQVISNKTLTTSDVIVDATDNTKKLVFSLSGMNTGTTLTLSAAMSASGIYTIPDVGTSSSFLLSNYSGTQTIATGNVAILSTAISTSSSTGAVIIAGGIYVGAQSLMAGGVSHTGSGNTTPSLSSFYIAPTSTTLSSGNYYFSYLGVPTTTGNTTGSAYTLYVAGAPSGATTSYSAYVATGKTYVGGPLQISTGATSGYVLTSDSVGNATWLVTGNGGFPNGSVSNPSIFFTSETNYGIYYTGGVAITANGTQIANFTSAGITIPNTAGSTSSSTGALQIAGGTYNGGASVFASSLSMLTQNGTNGSTPGNSTNYISLYDNPIFLRGLAGSDENHYLIYGEQLFALVDGPALIGYSGGQLGYSSNGGGWCLKWDNSENVFVNQSLTVSTGSLTLTVGAETGYLLQSNASGQAYWTNPASLTTIGVPHFFYTSTTATTTTSTTFAAISGASLTPTTAGTYLISFVANMYISVGLSTVKYGLAYNGTQISGTTVSVYMGTATATSGYQVIVNATQECNGTTDTLTAIHASASAVATLTELYKFFSAVRVGT